MIESISSYPDIYIHVGANRCGSTFLQRQVFPNIPGVFDVLSNRGDFIVNLMNAMDEHELYFDADAWREKLLGQLQDINAKTVLISEEELLGDYGHFNSDGTYICEPFFYHKERARRLAALFPKAKILIYVRRQDKWIESAYMHFIHNHKSIPFQKFIRPGLNGYKNRARQPGCNIESIDWERYVRTYTETFGQDNVLVVPQEMLANDMMVALTRLYYFMNIRADIKVSQSVNVNRSYGPIAFSLAMILNRFVHTPSNRMGIIPHHPFIELIQRKRAASDNRFWWFVGGLSRRISLFWFLSEIIGRFDKKRIKHFDDDARTTLLQCYESANRRLADAIGIDLSKYGYY